MHKSNVIVMAIMFVASVFFLLLWYFLDFDDVDNPVDLILIVSWWVLIVLSCVAIHLVEKRRQQHVRTCYVSAGLIYNSEVGVRMLGERSVTDELQNILESLEYNFDIAPEPSRDPGYLYVVHSDTFKAVATATVESLQRDPRWEGDVNLVFRPKADPIPFANKPQLSDIVDAKQ